MIIATPDHQHAKMLKASVEARKDVYCEKPMGNVLSETNEALAAVEKSGRIVQIGTQRRSYPRYRSATDMIKEGRVGDIVKVDVSWNAYSPYRWARKARGSGFVEGKRRRLGGIPDGEALPALRPQDLPFVPTLSGLLERNH